MNGLKCEFEYSITHKKIYTDNQRFTKVKSVPKCSTRTSENDILSYSLNSLNLLKQLNNRGNIRDNS